MARTYQEVLSRASSFLEEQGKEGYAIQYLFLARKNWSKTDWLLNMRQPISKEEEQQIERDVALLMQNHPPQYLIGTEEFYGRRFKVNQHTLIPRPETEELVELCLTNCSNEALRVVDVGTGTGAIAITLKLERPNWQVSAVDISPEALLVAKENKEALKAAVDFYLGDTLAPIEGPIDVLISNPPYISESEWEYMDESVRLFEPKLALFAENNGLAIYEKLAQEAQGKLSPQGKIFLEIGFQQGEAVKEIFQQAFPTKIVEIHQDLSGKDRMVTVY
ncbi:peptide chain release factor N(5)-glutamine methyltransferase [Enterococcus saccharolyticus]|uniref:peptide chain release factor N(5)-glutamine methyltransferase n=1 Tax=Enterococcus saccharolyticus TaxID=41997 RepID=UPI001E2E9D30|nr:peptide chain release factor N(5)-glutamine methyltransferase [Enterococcus saccharolyticus]MCD5001283.1 peptide chain release factor N(5)-glutamine methyltransferase [Enterococcus saccharolyticus]